MHFPVDELYEELGECLKSSLLKEKIQKVMIRIELYERIMAWISEIITSFDELQLEYLANLAEKMRAKNDYGVGSSEYKDACTKCRQCQEKMESQYEDDDEDTKTTAMMDVSCLANVFDKKPSNTALSWFVLDYLANHNRRKDEAGSEEEE